MKRNVALLCLVLVSFIAHAQDTLKIMTYNILNYQYSDNSRDQYFRTVIRHVRPDVLVVQEIHDPNQQAAVDSFYSRVVNTVFPGQFSKGTFIPDPNDTGNEVFYRSSKFTFVSNIPIHTVLRDINQFTLYNAAAADTIRIYSLHLKASTGFETNRAAEVDSLRKVTNALPNGKYFIVCGDYNIYRSTESAYQKLLQENPTDDGNVVDALTMPGTWNSIPAYAAYHTQSTRFRALPDGGATGGLDDRFDMILYSRATSQLGRIQYLAGSLTPIGNDGNHCCDDSINQMPNTAVPDSVANALYFASDHLPVTARFIFQGGTPLSAEPTLQASSVQFNAVTSSSMQVTWTPGNGTDRVVLAKAGSAVSLTPTDGQSYTANNNFASAPDLGSGNKAVFSASGNSVTVTGLGSNITYHFAVYEFNGSGGAENYLTTSPATNNQTTLTSTYYSQGNFAPDVVSNWNSDRGGLGTQPSDFTSGVPFVIQNGHTMITTAPWTLSGTGNRIQIESGGILQADHLISTAAFQIDNGGTYIHNTVGSGANGVTTDLPGSSTRSFSASSTVQFKKWGVVTGTQPVALPSGVSWGNLIINIDTLGGSWQQQAALTTIAGNLIIQKTGGGTREFRLNANTPSTLTVTIAGDLSVSGGILNLINGSSILTLSLGGNFSQTGGTFNASGAGPHNFSFTGGTPFATFASAGGTFSSTSINWAIPPGKTLTLNSNLSLASNRTLTSSGTLSCGTYSITGAGSVTVSTGATLGVGSGDGINSGTSLGNIRVSGSRIFDPATNYVFDGTTAQVTGNGFPASVNNLTINNANGVVLTGSGTVNGTLILGSGALSMGLNTLTLNGDIDETAGMLSGGPSSSVTLGGTGPSASLPAVNLQNLTIDRANGISLAGPVSIFGALTITNGILSTGDNIITLGPAATLNELAAYPILGTITTTRDVVQSANNSFGGLGIELNAAGATPGSTIVTRQTGIASMRNDSQSILRFFDLSPETNVGLDATLVFHFETSEVNGHSTPSLQLWKSEDAGNSWQHAGGVVNASARTVTLSGVSALSRWTAADTIHWAIESQTRSYTVSSGWDMLSLPLAVANPAKSSVFPTATSPAFRYVGGSPPQGYVQTESLTVGAGYWLKFDSNQNVVITGATISQDTVPVTTGWNLIGAITDSLPSTSIQQVPSGIVASPFFGYNGSYFPATVLSPARSYWVKASQNGSLIFSNQAFSPGIRKHGTGEENMRSNSTRRDE